MRRKRQTHCLDCGEQLDVFGICPMAEPSDINRMTAPVNCGMPPHEVDRIISCELKNVGMFQLQGVMKPAQARHFLRK